MWLTQAIYVRYSEERNGMYLQYYNKNKYFINKWTEFHLVKKQCNFYFELNSVDEILWILENLVSLFFSGRAADQCM